MNGGRCQVCGRRKGERAAGGLVLHYVGGVPCAGVGAPPIEVDDAALVAAVDQAKAARRDRGRELQAKRAELADLVERRANYIPPELEAAIARLQRLESDAWRHADKLERRLRRHRAWPARFAREMERDGCGMRPPAYLEEGARLDQLEADRLGVSLYLLEVYRAARRAEA